MTVRELVEKKRYINPALVGLAVVFGLAALADAVGYGFRAFRLARVLTAAEKKTEPDEKAVEAQASKIRARVEALKRRNAFLPPPGKPQRPVCVGIFGDMAFFGDKPYTVGQEVNGAKILEVGPNYVTIEWEGEPVKLEPFAVDNLTEEQKRAARSSGRGESRGDDRRESDRGPSRGGSERRPQGGPPEGRFRFQPSPEMIQRMREARERYMKASPEERERMREEFRRRMQERGFGPPGGFRGRGRD